MSPDQLALLSYTIDHFKEIARVNRFPENGKIPHDTSRCLICHPELISVDPFEIYLQVVCEAVKVRRPRLDESLIDEINADQAFLGNSVRVSRESLLAGDPEALSCWAAWILDAISTGLALLSVHSDTSCEVTLEDGESRGLGDLIEGKVSEIMEFQKQNE